MGANTAIGWCDHTFNPWIGCSKVSAGCTHCYAEALMDHRWNKVTWGDAGQRQATSRDYWQKPLKWNRWGWKTGRQAGGRRQRVFCGSLCDVFEDRPDVFELQTRLFELIARTRNLDWLLLTKRPENVQPLIPSSWEVLGWPDNVWLGVSVENQETASLRIPILETIPAPLRFLSVEPLLESVHPVHWGLKRIGWVIVGGESGKDARSCDVSWIRTWKTYTHAAGVPLFVKQLGSRPVETVRLRGAVIRRELTLRHPKGEDPAEWPQDLRIQQIPDSVVRAA